MGYVCLPSNNYYYFSILIFTANFILVYFDFIYFEIFDS